MNRFIKTLLLLIVGHFTVVNLSLYDSIPVNAKQSSKAFMLLIVQHLLLTRATLCKSAVFILCVTLVRCVSFLVDYTTVNMCYSIQVGAVKFCVSICPKK